MSYLSAPANLKTSRVRFWPYFALLLVCAGLVGCSPNIPEPQYYSAETATKSYADVLAELEVAITGRNYHIIDLPHRLTQR